MLRQTLLLYKSESNDAGLIDASTQILQNALGGPADAVSAALVEIGRIIERNVRAGAAPQVLCSAVMQHGKPAEVLDQVVQTIACCVYADALVEVRGMGVTQAVHKVAF